jgi:hypothetical protein
MPAVEDAVANHHIVELLGGSSRYRAGRTR